MKFSIKITLVIFVYLLLFSPTVFSADPNTNCMMYIEFGDDLMSQMEQEANSSYSSNPANFLSDICEIDMQSGNDFNPAVIMPISCDDPKSSNCSIENPGSNFVSCGDARSTGLNSSSVDMIFDFEYDRCSLKNLVNNISKDNDLALVGSTDKGRSIRMITFRPIGNILSMYLGTYAVEHDDDDETTSEKYIEENVPFSATMSNSMTISSPQNIDVDDMIVYIVGAPIVADASCIGYNSCTTRHKKRSISWFEKISINNIQSDGEDYIGLSTKPSLLLKENTRNRRKVNLKAPLTLDKNGILALRDIDFYVYPEGRFIIKNEATLLASNVTFNYRCEGEKCERSHSLFTLSDIKDNPPPNIGESTKESLRNGSWFNTLDLISEMPDPLVFYHTKIINDINVVQPPLIKVLGTFERDSKLEISTTEIQNRLSTTTPNPWGYPYSQREGISAENVLDLGEEKIDCIVSSENIDNCSVSNSEIEGIYKLSVSNLSVISSKILNKNSSGEYSISTIHFAKSSKVVAYLSNKKIREIVLKPDEDGKIEWNEDIQLYQFVCDGEGMVGIKGDRERIISCGCENESFEINDELYKCVPRSCEKDQKLVTLFTDENELRDIYCKTCGINKIPNLLNNEDDCIECAYDEYEDESNPGVCQKLEGICGPDDIFKNHRCEECFVENTVPSVNRDECNVCEDGFAELEPGKCIDLKCSNSKNEIIYNNSCWKCDEKMEAIATGSVCTECASGEEAVKIDGRYKCMPSEIEEVEDDEEIIDTEVVDVEPEAEDQADFEESDFQEGITVTADVEPSAGCSLTEAKHNLIAEYLLFLIIILYVVRRKIAK